VRTSALSGPFGRIADVAGVDVAGVCLQCRMIFLLPSLPGVTGGVPGLMLAGLCTDCDGVVIAVDAAQRRLADLVVVIRAADARHAETLRRLVASWALAPPSPLAALAELGPVAPRVGAVIEADDAPVTERRALGALLVLLLPPLLEAAAGAADPDQIALTLLLDRVTPGSPRPMVA
jgi:hypothetical protein